MSRGQDIEPPNILSQWFPFAWQYHWGSQHAHVKMPCLCHRRCSRSVRVVVVIVPSKHQASFESLVGGPGFGWGFWSFRSFMTASLASVDTSWWWMLTVNMFLKQPLESSSSCSVNLKNSPQQRSREAMQTWCQKLFGQSPCARQPYWDSLIDTIQPEDILIINFWSKRGWRPWRKHSDMWKRGNKWKS